MMSQICSIESCKRSSCALCHCCQQNICLPHLKEHQDLLVSELNPFVDEINELSDRLKAINVTKKIADARQKLEEWRAECHQKIDHFFNRKCRELDQHVNGNINEQREEVSRIQSKTAELIREQQATRRDLHSLRSKIDHFKRGVTKIERSSVNIRCHSLKIDDGWIIIDELNRHRIERPLLPPISKHIKYSPQSSTAIASNDHVLLMNQHLNLCVFDRTLTIVKQGLWNNGGIFDMCWSSALNRFIVLGENDVFLVDQEELSIENILTFQREKLFSCTCSNRSLYLSTDRYGSSIMEYNL